jgi:predicted Zn-dependent protease
MLFVSGCIQTQPQLKQSKVKAYEREDEYIMYALDAYERKDYSRSAQYFEELYRNTNNEAYLYEQIKMLMSHADYEAVEALSSKELLKNSGDVRLMRLKISALINLERLEEAKSLALNLVSMSKEEGDYLIVSDIYHRQDHYDTAIKYLERAYTIAYNEEILDRLVVTLYVNLDRKEEAISYLETHNRLHGCSNIVCTRLAGFYSNQNNIEGMLSIYLRMYEENQNLHVAEAIINIYSYKKDYPQLMVFLENSSSNDELLLRLYINTRQHLKASELAKKIYKERGETYFLGQSAIFFYEAQENKNDSIMLHKVINTLKEVVLQNEDALFLNYLGYLMIDHNIEVDEGIGYVRRALVLEPESLFYMDSLAWGYFKQKKCSEAYELMKHVIEKLGSEDEEVQSHMNAIKKCLKGKK